LLICIWRVFAAYLFAACERLPTTFRWCVGNNAGLALQVVQRLRLVHDVGEYCVDVRRGSVPSRPSHRRRIQRQPAVQGLLLHRLGWAAMQLVGNSGPATGELVLANMHRVVAHQTEWVANVYADDDIELMFQWHPYWILKVRLSEKSEWDFWPSKWQDQTGFTLRSSSKNSNDAAIRPLKTVNISAFV